jgi:diguanylate cyclase (GGDEF)-like protein/MYXO-CTERM domain-containing protein
MSWPWTRLHGGSPRDRAAQSGRAAAALAWIRLDRRLGTRLRSHETARRDSDGPRSSVRPVLKRLKLSGHNVEDSLVLGFHDRSTRPGHASALKDLERDSAVPDAADLNFMRRVGIAMFLLGSITLLATLPLPDPDPSDHGAIKLIAALLALGAGFSWAVRRRRAMRLNAIYGILLVSALMAVTRPIEATPFFYLWPMLYSAYFFSRRALSLDLLIMWVTLGLALFVWSVDPMKQVLFMGVGVSVTLTAIVVILLRERLTTVIGELARSSATDYLTGLLNRRAFDAEFLRQIERARRSDLPLALVLFDLDYFKQVNDRLGHAAGDRALCDFAALLKRALRRGDTLARIGGEEFAVVLFGVDQAEAVAFAERIGLELQEAKINEAAPLSASAGVAALREGAQDASTLLVDADRALYGAKEAGRRRVAAWEEGAIRVGSRLGAVEAVPVSAAR